MKNIMYGSISVLCLAIAFHLGAVSVRGEYVDHSATGVVAYWCGNEGGFTPRVLDENGVSWEISQTEGWVQKPSIPVPLSEVKFWSAHTLLTVDDHAWVYVGVDQWEDIGGWPGGGASQTQETSWGRVKAEFRE